MNQNQQKNFDFLISDQPFLHFYLDIGYDISFFQLFLKEIIEKNLLFKENEIIQFIDHGSYGIVYKLLSGRIIKFFWRSFVHDSPINFDPDLEAAAEIENANSDRVLPRLFSGESRLSQLAIFDNGKLDLGIFSGKNIFYRVVPELIPLVDFYVKLHRKDPENGFYDAVSSIAHYVTIQSIFQFCQEKELDFDSEIEFWRRNLKRRILFQHDEMQLIQKMSFFDFAKKYCRSLSRMIEFIPEFSPSLFAKKIYLECKEIVEEALKSGNDFDYFILSDVKLENIGLLPQNKSIPIIFDF